MKTRNLVCGALVVAISALTLGRVAAQQTQPTVKILPGSGKDMIKILYCGRQNGAVTVEFVEDDGASILVDKIESTNFEKGFLKTYKVNRAHGDSFWAEVRAEGTFVRYKVFGNNFDEWTAKLEKETYNYPVIASK
jgi:hypothetical protein